MEYVDIHTEKQNKLHDFFKNINSKQIKDINVKHKKIKPMGL